MFDKLSHGIPLAEASAFFIKLRDFSKTADGYAPPDETGTLEGQFAAPVEQVLAQLGKMVQNELKTNYAYMAYANSLRDLSHHAIAEEFENHAHDETDHADWLLRRMGVLGGPINLPDIPAPPASTDPHDIVQTMIRMEQEGIENWRILRNMVGDENPMKFKIEEYLTAEQEHLDELWQLVPHEANPAVLMQAKGNVMQTSEQPQVPPSAPDTSPAPPEKTSAVMPDPERQARMRALLQTPEGMQHALQLAHSNMNYQRVTGELSPETKEERQKFVDKNMKGRGLAGGVLGAVPGAMLGFAAGKGFGNAGQIAGGALGGLAGGTLGGLAERGLIRRAATNYANKGIYAATVTPEMIEARMGKAAADLTAASRDQIAKKNFALSAKQSNTGKPAYPIHDKAHAANALARVKQHGSPAEKSEVYKDVARKFPELASKSSVPALKAKEKNSEMSLPPTAMGQQSAPPQLTPLMGAAAGQHAKMAAKMASVFKKIALEEGMPASQEEGLPPAEEEVDPTILQYLQQEQEGMAAEKAQEEAFYKQRFQEASQQLQAAQSQLAQLQQQADASGQVNAQMMQQAQQIQQAAAQNAAAAHQAATQAMQQSLQAQNESIQQAQLAVGMRDSVHAMRHSLLELVQQQLPPATPAETAAIQADQQAAQMGMMGGGMDNTQQAPGAEGEVPGANQAGQPGTQPDAGTPPQSATPGTGNGPGTSPSAGQGASPTMEGAQPQGEQGMQQQPPKTAAATPSSHDAFLGAIMGGLVGGGGSAIESQMSNDKLRSKVKKLEEADKAGGGFVNALNLAQSKYRLALGEFSEKHPIASTAIGTGVGAAVGSQLLPALRDQTGV